MLFYGAVHQALFVRRLVDGGEELVLLVMMMLRDAVMPSYTVADKLLLVGRLDARSLLIDAIEASDEGVVAQGHVGGFDGKWVCLIKAYQKLHTAMWARTGLLCQSQTSACE